MRCFFIILAVGVVIAVIVHFIVERPKPLTPEEMKEFLKPPTPEEMKMLDDWKAQERSRDEAQQVKCPICRSNQITANNKGFGVGKAAAGGLLLGPVGLLGGFIGSGKVKITCLKCGHTWKP